MNTQKQIFLIVVLFFAFTGACAAYTAIDLPIRAEDQEQWHFEESVERGALLFANNCRTCHGNAGQGGVGPQLNREEFRNQDPILLKTNRDMIRRTITCGRAGTAMPTWGQSAGGPLNAVQVEHLVDFLTAPAEDEENEEGPNKGWIDAVEFAHNLNSEASAVVGGDTLGTIAEAHAIGFREIADLNGLEPDSQVPKGTRIKLPPNNEFPQGRTVKIFSDNQTVPKIADEFQVGAMMLAELNGLDYEYDADTNTVKLVVDGDDVPGLLPGEELELPDGAVLIVSPGDTIEAIAETHNVSPTELKRLNPDYLASLADDELIPAERTLVLPANPTWVAQAGDTYELIASLHGIEPAELVAENQGIDLQGTPTVGQVVQLPDDVEYTIQLNDTLAMAASRHQTTADELARLNELDEGPDDPLDPAVVLVLPKVNAYVVQGQSLEEVADGFSNGDADQFAEVNNVSPDEPLRVGTQLVLPEDVWGTAPATSTNLGTGCTQFTVPNSVYEEIIGLGGPPEPPAEISQDVEIVANSNDWTVIADGETSAPNEGAVSVARGTTIDFRVAVGIHTITLEVDDEKEVVNPDFADGDTDTVTFGDPGTFAILCDIHPAMLAWVFVQEAGAAASPTAAAGTPTATAGAGN